MKQESKGKRALRALRLLRHDAPLRNIRRALKELYGYELEEIGRIAGCGKGTVSQVINGFRQNRRVQETIAALWGVPREEVFDDGDKMA